jgi:transposase
MVVTEEGLPLSYEVFEGNRADVTTLEEILDSVERKHGKLGRVWVFDRGIFATRTDPEKTIACLAL